MAWKRPAWAGLLSISRLLGLFRGELTRCGGCRGLGRRLLPGLLFGLLGGALLQELALAVQLRHRRLSLAAGHACSPPLKGGDVCRRGALGSLFGVVADLCALGERLEAAALNCGVMDEEVLAGIIGRDETKALFVVEPFHGSCCHFSPSGVCALRYAEGAL